MEEGSTEVIVHRTGYTRPKETDFGSSEQNTIHRARETLSNPNVSGVEIDVNFTSDGVAVVTHEDVSKMTFEEFQQDHPDNATLESWVDWFKDEEALADKKLAIDFKTRAQDPYRVIELVQDLDDRVIIGSTDPGDITKLSHAKKTSWCRHKSVYDNSRSPAPQGKC